MFLRIILFSFLTLSLSSCFSNKKKNQNIEDSASIKSFSVDKNGLSLKSAFLQTAHGTIELKFYPKKAPQTVRRVVMLIDSGFYDGLTFHRVVPNFVIQSGDPTATGRGGSGKKIKAEFNDIQHIRGTWAMARSQDINSADSQFYIALNTLPNLDKKFTVFGQVVHGFEVLDKISKGDKIISLKIR